MKRILLNVFIALLIGVGAQAQDEVVSKNPADDDDGKAMTIEELQAERAALVALSKSDEFLAKLAKADKLKAPKESGVAGVDALIDILGPMVQQLHDSRTVIPELYASVTRQTIDGTAATNANPVTTDQLLALSKMFVQMGATIVKSSKDLVSLPGEIKSAGPMKMLKSVKSIAYIKDAIGVLNHELGYSSKMVRNLIATHNLQNNN